MVVKYMHGEGPTSWSKKLQRDTRKCNKQGEVILLIYTGILLLLERETESLVREREREWDKRHSLCDMERERERNRGFLRVGLGMKRGVERGLERQTSERERDGKKAFKWYIALDLHLSLNFEICGFFTN